MPTHIPRTEPIRKKEQLLDSTEKLRLAILHEKSVENIRKLTERYRLANISLLKAKIHTLNELNIQGRNVGSELVKLVKEKDVWNQKSLDVIFAEFKANLSNN